MFRPAPHWEPAAQGTGSKQTAHLSSPIFSPCSTSTHPTSDQRSFLPTLAVYFRLKFHRVGKKQPPLWEHAVPSTWGVWVHPMPAPSPVTVLTLLMRKLRLRVVSKLDWCPAGECLSLGQNTYLQTPRSANAAPPQSKIYPSPLTRSELSVREGGEAASQGSLFHCQGTKIRPHPSPPAWRLGSDGGWHRNAAGGRRQGQVCSTGQQHPLKTLKEAKGTFTWASACCRCTCLGASSSAFPEDGAPLGKPKRRRKAVRLDWPLLRCITFLHICLSQMGPSVLAVPPRIPML